jgi:hypothetical protein
MPAQFLPFQKYATANVFLDGKNFLPIYIQKSLSFWEVKQKQISIQDVSTQGSSIFASLKSPTLFLSDALFSIKPLRECIVNNKIYYIYRIDGLDPKVLRPGIFTSAKDGK